MPNDSRQDAGSRIPPRQELAFARFCVSFFNSSTLRSLRVKAAGSREQVAKSECFTCNKVRTRLKVLWSQGVDIPYAGGKELQSRKQVCSSPRSGVDWRDGPCIPRNCVKHILIRRDRGHATQQVQSGFEQLRRRPDGSDSPGTLVPFCITCQNTHQIAGVMNALRLEACSWHRAFHHFSSDGCNCSRSSSKMVAC